MNKFLNWLSYTCRCIFKISRIEWIDKLLMICLLVTRNVVEFAFRKWLYVRDHAVYILHVLLCTYRLSIVVCGYIMCRWREAPARSHLALQCVRIHAALEIPMCSSESGMQTDWWITCRQWKESHGTGIGSWLMHEIAAFRWIEDY
jgi:hypothetical protein